MALYTILVDHIVITTLNLKIVCGNVLSYFRNVNIRVWEMLHDEKMRAVSCGALSIMLAVDRFQVHTFIDKVFSGGIVPTDGTDPRPDPMLTLCCSCPSEYPFHLLSHGHSFKPIYMNFGILKCYANPKNRLFAKWSACGLTIRIFEMPYHFHFSSEM